MTNFSYYCFSQHGKISYASSVAVMLINTAMPNKFAPHVNILWNAAPAAPAAAWYPSPLHLVAPWRGCEPTHTRAPIHLVTGGWLHTTGHNYAANLTEFPVATNHPAPKQHWRVPTRCCWKGPATSSPRSSAQPPQLTRFERTISSGWVCYTINTVCWVGL